MLQIPPSWLVYPWLQPIHRFVSVKLPNWDLGGTVSWNILSSASIWKNVQGMHCSSDPAFTHHDHPFLNWNHKALLVRPLRLSKTGCVSGRRCHPGFEVIIVDGDGNNMLHASVSVDPPDTAGASKQVPSQCQEQYFSRPDQPWTFRIEPTKQCGCK